MPDTTYHWHIDEVDGGTVTGDPWSFTTARIDDGLSAHYTLDTVDVSGSTAFDCSPAPNYDGTITSSPSNVTGKIGQALDFDGTNDYIDIPRMISDDFTISFWIKPTIATLDQNIIAKRNVANDPCTRCGSPSSIYGGLLNNK